MNRAYEKLVAKEGPVKPGPIHLIPHQLTCACAPFEQGLEEFSQ